MPLHRQSPLAASDATWRQHLGPLLEVGATQRLLRVRSPHAVHDLAHGGHLLALSTREGRALFPAFQFTDEGRPHEALPAVLAAFDDADADPWTVASWLATPRPELGGERPIDWLKHNKDRELIVLLAHQAAAPLRW